MWSDLQAPWKAAFEQGWEAFCHGSIPIGASIADGDGHILSVGQNRVFDRSLKNPRVAHAEVDAIWNLDTAKYQNIHNYVLYACMEPCPMCLGTIVMSDLEKVCVAARDAYCGAMHLCSADPYIAAKRMQIKFEYGLLEAVQLVMQTYFELKIRNGSMNVVTKAFEQCNPKAVSIAKSHFENRSIDSFAQSGYAFGFVFDELAKEYGYPAK